MSLDNQIRSPNSAINAFVHILSLDVLRQKTAFRSVVENQMIRL